MCFFRVPNGIVHFKTTPGHSATNGAIENSVKISKHALSAALSDPNNKNISKSIFINTF